MTPADDIDEKIAASTARLDARPEPEPPPELPPLEVTTTTIMDLRLVVIEESGPHGARLGWRVLDKDGTEVPAQPGLGSIIALGAQLVAGSGGWRQDFHRACVRLVEANANYQRFNPPHPPPVIQ